LNLWADAMNTPTTYFLLIVGLVLATFAIAPDVPL
jgi:hypothetical protein